jgi:acetyl-CoA carboxylase carboxyl transferase subunit beta
MVWPRRSKQVEGTDGLGVKCNDCSEIIFSKKLDETSGVCPKCNYHFRLGARERISLLLEDSTFEECNSQMTSCDPLNFQGVEPYRDKIIEGQKKTGLTEAVVTGEGYLNNHPLVIAVTDSRFMMGSMGSVVGEKIARAAERAIEKRLPFLTVSGSGGGARMQEGMFSLMQMAKVSSAIARLNKERLLFVSILTDPTMGGVAASFAFLGDIIIAEPRALIGFAGPRVIMETIHRKLPQGFQRAEFLFKRGLIDMIVPRGELKKTLSELLDKF